MNDIVEYKLLLSRLAAARSESIITNSSTDHAAALIVKLSKSANKEIRLLSGFLNSLVYDKTEVIEAFRIFLQKTDAKLTVILEHGYEQATDFGKDFVIAVTKYADKVKFFELDEATSISVQSHYLWNDTSGFRLEVDKTKPEAMASFNSPDLAKKIHDVLESFIKPVRRIAIDKIITIASPSVAAASPAVTVSPATQLKS